MIRPAADHGPRPCGGAAGEAAVRLDATLTPQRSYVEARAWMAHSKPSNGRASPPDTAARTTLELRTPTTTTPTLTVALTR